jgi:hypothetical protein
VFADSDKKTFFFFVRDMTKDSVEIGEMGGSSLKTAYTESGLKLLVLDSASQRRAFAQGRNLPPIPAMV